MQLQVSCKNGATMVLSGAATALIAQGTRVEIFGSKGTLAYDGQEVTVAVRGEDGAPNASTHAIHHLLVMYRVFF